MADANLQSVLQAHGITASPRQLAEYLVESVEAMEEGALIPAAQELSESELEVLRSGGFDVDAGPSPRDDPIARASAAYSALMETALTIKAVATALGRNESRVRQRLLQRSLYGIRRRRNWLLPLFQFQVEDRKGTRTVQGVVPAIEQVFPALSPELHPVSVWRWFTSPSTELVDDTAPDKGISPRDWLLAGRDPKPVADLARDL
ncbi:MAG: hypothetical protein U9Q81_15480 [Pseudomonadota bacterium]|nr:hypothetical protein [Pseudomonadota bacterium]